ncbi:MAG: hypothetical protein WDZ35_03235 [Crocinitomicaceae bacterium]
MKYKEIQAVFCQRNEKTISSCAIADAKRKLGYPVKFSSNRINKTKIQKEATTFEIIEVKRILRVKNENNTYPSAGASVPLVLAWKVK